MDSTRELIGFAEEQPARLLVHYLQAQGLDAQYIHSDGEFAHVVIIAEEGEVEARQIVQEFIDNPTDQKYQSQAWGTADSVTLAPSKSFSWSTVLTQLASAPFTSLVLVLCLVSFITSSIGLPYAYQALHIEPIGSILASGEWWRIIGPALIHLSLLHIVFNLLWWWTLAQQIEQRFGTLGLLCLFLFSALLSNVGQLLVSGPNFGGLSGVVYALVGCIWWLGWLRPTWGLNLPKPLVGFMLIWLLLGYTDLLPVNMANTAHSLGLVSGCIFAWLLTRFSSGDKGNS